MRASSIHRSVHHRSIYRSINAVVGSLALAHAFGAAGATINSWIPTATTPQTWNLGANWSTASTPQATEAAVFASGSLPIATTSITVDAPQTFYGMLFNPGSGGRVATYDVGTAGQMTVLSTDTTSDGTSTFVALSATSGSVSFNAPIQLGNGASGSFTATIFSSVNSNNMVFNSVISESAGQKWGVRVDGNGSGTVNFASPAKTYSGDTTITTTGRFRTNNTNLIPDGAGKGNLVIEGSGQYINNNADETLNGINSTSSTALINKIGSNTRTFTFGNGDASGSFNGNITESAGTWVFTKIGNGAQAFGGTNNSNGSIMVNGGALLINGSITPRAGNAFTYAVAAGATLGGTGSINQSAAAANTGAVNVSGSIAPGGTVGPTPGALDIARTIAFATGSSYQAEIGGNAPGDSGSAYDQLNMTFATGAVSLTGTVNLNLSLIGGFTPASSDVYYVLTRADAGAFSTLFNATTEGGIVDLGGGYKGQITYLSNWTGTQAGSSLTGGNDVAIYNVTIPEPMGLSLLSLAVLGLVRRRRSCGR